MEKNSSIQNNSAEASLLANQAYKLEKTNE